MASLNKVLLIGNLTRDPEMKYLSSGSAMARFGLAMNRNYTTNDGEKREDVCYVSVTAWGRTAEVAQEYLQKGSPAFIEGRLRYYQIEGDDGQKRSGLEVVAERLQLLPRGSNGKEDASAPEVNAQEYQDELPF